MKALYYIHNIHKNTTSKMSVVTEDPSSPLSLKPQKKRKEKKTTNHL